MSCLRHGWKKKKKGQPACLMLAWDHIPNVAAAGECEVLAEMTVFRFGGWLLSGPSWLEFPNGLRKMQVRTNREPNMDPYALISTIWRTTEEGEPLRAARWLDSTKQVITKPPKGIVTGVTYQQLTRTYYVCLFYWHKYILRSFGISLFYKLLCK